MRSKRVILDTNLWISFLISKRLEYLDELLLTGKIKLLFSDESLEEFLTVARRPKFARYFSDENIQELTLIFDKYSELVKISSQTDKCRDVKDNFLLNLAIDGKANYLVTGDAELLVIEKIKKTKIINWSTFVDEHK